MVFKGFKIELVILADQSVGEEEAIQVIEDFLSDYAAFKKVVASIVEVHSNVLMTDLKQEKRKKSDLN